MHSWSCAEQQKCLAYVLSWCPSINLQEKKDLKKSFSPDTSSAILKLTGFSLFLKVAVEGYSRLRCTNGLTASFNSSFAPWHWLHTGTLLKYIQSYAYLFHNRAQTAQKSACCLAKRHTMSLSCISYYQQWNPTCHTTASSLAYLLSNPSLPWKHYRSLTHS